MPKRLLEVNREEAKVVKSRLPNAKNDTERKRIQIVVLYLWWQNTAKVRESMLVSNVTVLKAVNGYKEKWEDFYKTNWKWRQENEYHKKLATQAKAIIKSGENVDINEVKRKLEKMNGEEYGYEKIHWLVRRKLWYNYQKPFVTSKKQSEYAKEIAEWRMRKWLFEIGLEEWKIDAESVQNKKIKIWGVAFSDVNMVSGWKFIWDIPEDVKGAV